MYEQDYMMSQIRRFFEALGQILLMKREGKQKAALKLIDQSLSELFERNGNKIHELSLEETIFGMEQDGKFNAELAVIVADILYEKGELIDEANRYKCFMQALLLYKKSGKSADLAFPLQSLEKITRIERLLDKSDLEKINDIV